MPIYSFAALLLAALWLCWYGSACLFYTHNRKGFTHLRFNRAWIDANL